MLISSHSLNKETRPIYLINGWFSLCLPHMTKSVFGICNQVRIGARLQQGCSCHLLLDVFQSKENSKDALDMFTFHYLNESR